MKTKGSFFTCVSFVVFTVSFCMATAQTPKGVWSIEKANAWYNSHKWLTGADYIPATAINQLEMWQGDTFDPATIDKELGWAENIGFNTMRVFLHSVAWKQD
jgi:hypothetical protein